MLIILSSETIAKHAARRTTPSLAARCLATMTALCLAPGCQSTPAPAPTSAAVAVATIGDGGVENDVLAVVNGTPIREIDLETKLKNEMHGTELRAEYRANVLDAVVRDEVLASKAASLGLDQDAGYLQGLRPLQAQVDAYRRRHLVDRYLDHAAAAAAVGDADAKRYFDEHAAEIRSELHVFQILARDEGVAQAAKAALDGGKSFEEVSRGLLPGVADTEKPWDLGWVKWVMLPEPLRPVVAVMKQGDVSGVIRGPGKRFWILRLIERRDDPSITWEIVRGPLIESLRLQRLAKVRVGAEQDLLKSAKIVYRTPPTAAAK